MNYEILITGNIIMTYDNVKIMLLVSGKAKVDFLKLSEFLKKILEGITRQSGSYI